MLYRSDVWRQSLTYIVNKRLVTSLIFYVLIGVAALELIVCCNYFSRLTAALLCQRLKFKSYFCDNLYFKICGCFLFNPLEFRGSYSTTSNIIRRLITVTELIDN